MALRRTRDAVIEPLTLAEAKLHCKVGDEITEDDALISGLIAAAREDAEHELHRSLLTQTWTKTLDEFPEAIFLPYPPIQNVTSVKYLDTNGALQTLSDTLYAVDIRSEPGSIVPAYGTTWPDTYAAINAVEVVYVAGWTSVDDVPPQVKRWMKLRVATLYEHREEVALLNRGTIQYLPYVQTLLDRYRVYTF